MNNTGQFLKDRGIVITASKGFIHLSVGDGSIAYSIRSIVYGSMAVINKVPLLQSRLVSDTPFSRLCYDFLLFMPYANLMPKYFDEGVPVEISRIEVKNHVMILFTIDRYGNEQLVDINEWWMDYDRHEKLFDPLLKDLLI